MHSHEIVIQKVQGHRVRVIFFEEALANRVIRRAAVTEQVGRVVADTALRQKTTSGQ
jgi:hypothetical protein